MPNSGSGEEEVKKEFFFFPHNQDMGIMSYFLLSKEELSLNDPKQSSAGSVQDDLIKVGVQTLIDPTPNAPGIVHSYTSYTVPTVWKPWLRPPSMFRSRVTDDVIGTESGDYMSSNVEDLKGAVDRAETRRDRTRSRYRKSEKREFPRPIPLLTQTGGMPWVFRKETIDGRLIMRTERMKRRECFEAHRLNGRLTMKLVPQGDDAVYCEDCGHPVADGREQSGDDQDMKQESEECEDLCECIGCEEGLAEDLDPFWKGKGMEGPSGCLGRPTSTPLRPMTTVM